MTKKINIWGRDFRLNVIYDQYEGEEILDTQREALASFLNASDSLLKSYGELERYCIEKDQEQIGDSIGNIFKYVVPEMIFVRRSENKRVVLLLCNYRFDEEHGIAITFENEKLKQIGTQDDI